jgi:hypothetical protein
MLRLFPRPLLAVAAAVLLVATPVRAELTTEQIEHMAADIAGKLAATCPQTTYDDHAAYVACQAAYRISSPLPFAKSVLWGPDQTDLRIPKKSLTVVQSWVWQYLYMPNYAFTGRWSVGRDTLDNVNFIAVEAYFRNALPAGDYAYPFWHSAAKWTGNEHVNQFRFYLDGNGKIFMVGRSAAGGEEHRGPYAPAKTPAFDGNWQWVDADGKVQPHAELFSDRYSANNPYLLPLDKAYKEFALKVRDGTCLSCHTPANKFDVSRLILLQSPIHAAGEIDDVIKEVKNGDMPEDDIGLKKEIDPKLREAILKTGTVFQGALHKADQWEQAQKH